MSAYRRMHAGWISALGLISLATAVACSSGSSDVLGSPDGSGGSSSSGGSGSSSGGSSSGASGSGSSSGGGAATDAAATILFPFDNAMDTAICAANSKGCWFFDIPSAACVPGGAGEPGGAIGEAGASEAAASEAGASEAGSVEAGAAAEAGPTDASSCPYEYLTATVTYDPAVGDPLPGGDPGSMELVVPFNGYNQQSLLQLIFSTPIDLSNRILFVRVRLDSGFNPNPSAPGGFALAVKTGSTYAYGSSGYQNVSMSPTAGFVEFDLNLHATPADAATGFDPTNVVAIELHLDTGGGPTGGADAGSSLPTPATFHVDTVGYQ